MFPGSSHICFPAGSSRCALGFVATAVPPGVLDATSGGGRGLYVGPCWERADPWGRNNEGGEITKRI